MDKIIKENLEQTLAKLELNNNCIVVLKGIEQDRFKNINLIDLFNITILIDGVLGIRFLGAGFNGSSIALIDKDKYINIKKEISNLYLNTYHELENSFKIIPVTICDGVDI